MSIGERLLENAWKAEVQRFQEKWLNREVTKGKSIHVIPMHHDAAISVQKDFSSRSQRNVYQILESLRPTAVGIEGFTGDDYTIDAEAHYGLTTLRDNKLANKISYKQLRISIQKNINSGMHAPRRYVLDKKVPGFGLEHPRLYRDSFLVTLTKNMPFELVHHVAMRDLTQRSIYAMARAVQYLSSTGASGIIALPMGKLHIDDFKTLNEDWQLELIYHEDAI